MSISGLTKKEAENNLSKYGVNEIKDVSKKSPFKILLRQIKNNFIFYLLFLAMIVSFFVGKTTTAYVIFFVIIITIGTGFFQEYRAEKAVQALKNMIMPISIVIRDGKEQEIPSREIVPGDVLVLRSGEKIPADCLIIEESELIVNESSLTGESKEIRKIVTKLTNYKEENMVFMGTFVLKGRCIAKVLHTGMNARFGKISEMISSAEKELPLQEKLNKISKYMAFVAIFFSVITGLFMILSNPAGEGIYVEALILMIALSVSAFPEGLPVVLITCLSYGAHKMAKNNAIVNRLSVIESLGETTVICTDKTGTITRGEMTVNKVYSGGYMFEVSGAGYNAEGFISLNSKKIILEKYKTLNLLLQSAVICNDASIQRTGEDMQFKTIGSPTESAMLVLASKAELYKDDIEFSRIVEIPFDSSTKIMATLNKMNGEKVVFAKGAPEFLLKKCKFIQKDNGVFRLTERERKDILEINKRMSSSALRTIAFAYKYSKTDRKSSLIEDLIFTGFTGIRDPPRAEVKEAIRVCHGAGIKVKMITGDNMETAIAIANEVGLHGESMTGEDLDNLSDEELSDIVSGTVIFARVRPDHKLRIVKALKSIGEIVTMTGDGVNDAPALKEAHIGVAMGLYGTDVSRSVSDLTLKDDNFATIVSAIREGRGIFNNIRKFTGYILSCNYAELSILFMGVLLSPIFGWQIPLILAIQILFMNLVTDDLPAITLSMTPYSQDIMNEKPRIKEPIINKKIFLVSLLSGLLMMLVSLLVFYVEFNILGASIDKARTVALLTLILLEIANAYNFLSYKREVFFGTLFANKYLTLASAISIIATFIIIYTPANIIFGTVPIGSVEWLVGLGASFFIIIVSNIVKKINNQGKYLKLD